MGMHPNTTALSHQNTARLSQTHSKNKVSRDLRLFRVLPQNLVQLKVTEETSISLATDHNFDFAILKTELRTLNFLNKRSTVALS